MTTKKDKLQKGFANTSRKKQKDEKNKLPMNPEVIEKTTEKVHPEEQTLTPISKTEEETKKVRREKKREDEVKTSFDVPPDLYDAMRIHLIKKRTSMRTYLLDLIKQDLDR